MGPSHENEMILAAENVRRKLRTAREQNPF